MLEYLTLILICPLVGEFAVTGDNRPIPDPLAGTIFLFFFLVVRGHVPDEMASVTNTLLNNLSLLFVPAGVGVMAHLRLFGADAVPLSVALFISTVFTIIVAAFKMTLINRRILNSIAKLDVKDE